MDSNTLHRGKSRPPSKPNRNTDKPLTSYDDRCWFFSNRPCSRLESPRSIYSDLANGPCHSPDSVAPQQDSPPTVRRNRLRDSGIRADSCGMSMMLTTNVIGSDVGVPAGSYAHRWRRRRRRRRCIGFRVHSDDGGDLIFQVVGFRPPEDRPDHGGGMAQPAPAASGLREWVSPVRAGNRSRCYATSHGERRPGGAPATEANPQRSDRPIHSVRVDEKRSKSAGKW